MSGPIFGNSSALGGSSGGNRHLVEFRAGRMNMVGKMVHPDARKGLVYMYQAEDGLIHFCWKDRTTGNVEDDLIIFPDDCEFKRIEACKTGRVFLLKFKSSSRKLFFWLQEPKTEKDDEWCRRVNEVMNNPPSMNNSGSGSRTGTGGSGGTDGGDLQYMLNNMSQQQLMQLFGGVGQMGGLSSLLGSINRPSSGTGSSTSSSSTRLSSTTTPSRTATSPGTTPAANLTTPPATAAVPATPQAPKRPTRSNSKESSPAATANNTTTTGNTTGSTSATNANSRLLTELQNYLSGINPSAGGGSATAGRSRNVDLSSAINSEAVGSILSDPEFVTALQNHLPDVDSVNNSKDQLKDTLKSPQFQQALSMFSSALQSGQLGPVVSQFQMSPEVVAAANSGDIEQFVKALEKSVKDKKERATATAATSGDDAAAAATTVVISEGGETTKETEKKDDDNMQLG